MSLENNSEIQKMWAPFITMGSMGHYPIFEYDQTEMKEMLSPLPLSQKEQVLFVKILKSLATYSTLEKKKIAYTALTSDQRKVFVKGFYTLTEAYRFQEGAEFH